MDSHKVGSTTTVKSFYFPIEKRQNFVFFKKEVDNFFFALAPARVYI